MSLKWTEVTVETDMNKWHQQRVPMRLEKGEDTNKRKTISSERGSKNQVMVHRNGTTTSLAFLCATGCNHEIHRRWRPVSWPRKQLSRRVITRDTTAMKFANIVLGLSQHVSLSSELVQGVLTAERATSATMWHLPKLDHEIHSLTHSQNLSYQRQQLKRKPAPLNICGEAQHSIGRVREYRPDRCSSPPQTTRVGAYSARTHQRPQHTAHVPPRLPATHGVGPRSCSGAQSSKSLPRVLSSVSCISRATTCCIHQTRTTGDCQRPLPSAVNALTVAARRQCRYFLSGMLLLEAWCTRTTLSLCRLPSLAWVSSKQLRQRMLVKKTHASFSCRCSRSPCVTALLSSQFRNHIWL